MSTATEDAMSEQEAEVVRAARWVLSFVGTDDEDSPDVLTIARHILAEHDRRVRAREVANRAGVSCYADVSDEYERLVVQQATRIAELTEEVGRVTAQVNGYVWVKVYAERDEARAKAAALRAGLEEALDEWSAWCATGLITSPGAAQVDKRRIAELRALAKEKS